MTGLDGKGLAALARLAEAFDVAGKVGPDAPMLVLRMADAPVLKGSDAPMLVLRMADAPVLKGSDARCLDRLVADLRRLFQGPVLVVPHGWTQEQIDVEAARMLVLAEREACARIVESGSFGWWEDVGDLREMVAAMIRARGSK